MMAFLPTLLALLAFGFVVAGLIHISGVGAGVLLVPSLMFFLNFRPQPGWQQPVYFLSCFVWAVLPALGAVAMFSGCIYCVCWWAAMRRCRWRFEFKTS
jgi:uncharacterized membrane protein YfcA